MANDYNKAKIYALRSYQTPEIWIGSTTLDLFERMNNHRMFNNPGASWIIQDEVFKYGDCYIELIEKYPCQGSEELVKRMNEIIREMDCLNKKKEEYKARNQEEKRVKKNTKAKEYYRKNRDKINQYNKEYREKNKEKIKQRKSLREKNNEKIKQRKALRDRKRVVCGCGGSYGDYTYAKNKHLKTKKHQTYEFHLKPSQIIDIKQNNGERTKNQA